MGGDQKFAEWMSMEKDRLSDKCCIARMVNESDIVPTLYPKLMGFEHIGKLCLTSSSGTATSVEDIYHNLLINPSVEDIQTQKDSSEAGIAGILLDWLWDHMLDSYLDKLLNVTRIMI